MNLFRIKIFSFLSLLSLFAVSCINERLAEDEPLSIDKEHTLLVLNINPVSSRSGDFYGVIESIETLRIIMVDVSSDKIECNTKISSEYFNNGPDNEGLHYFFRITEPGEKRFYLFANEDYVESVNGGEKNLAVILENYKEGEVSTDIDTELNNLWFEPHYEIENNKISLPYSAYYQLNLEGGKRCEQPMYIVPVATKFYFKFINNREYKVNVTKLQLDKIGDLNFLLGHVNKSQQRKNLNNASYYWVDWLAEISEMSWRDPDNQSFNAQYGWISDFSLPSDATHKKHSFLVSPEKKEVPGKSEKQGGQPEPGTLSLGPFYLPESKYIPAKETNQSYQLLLQLEDTNPVVTLDEFDPIPLPNIGSLFRNTHVVINVTMDDGTDDIYVEIQSWKTTDNFYGTANKQQ